jgi:hypothetical protein
MLTPKKPAYRIIQADEGWHVFRPNRSLPHTFVQLDDALAFVQRDSDGAAELVELLVGQIYMVKRLDHTA